MQKPYLTNYNLLTTKDSWQVDNVAEGIHEVKGKYGHTTKNVKHVKLNTKIVIAVWNTKRLNMIQVNTIFMWQYLLPKKFGENIKKQFFKNSFCF